MLAEKQLKEWFHSNGVDIGVPFPTPLIGRLFRKALPFDNTLFIFLGKSFISHNPNSLVLGFTDWNEVFLCYKSYGVTSTVSEA